MGRSLSLLCAALPIGYGPAVKLVALARRLRSFARLVVVGEGSTLELVSRAPGAFDAVVAANPASPKALPWLRDAHAVLSIMDRDAGAAAARAGKPLFAVDSLLWMRPEIPEPLRGARAYFAQAFAGRDPLMGAPRPIRVGPLTEPRAVTRSAPRRGLVVNLGGSSAPDGRGLLFAPYARLALRAVVAAGLAERFGRATVIGGESAIAALSGVTGDPRVECVSLGPDEARERMAGAAALVTAPGLTTTLEAFSDRTPTWFLPPQNYSQWCLLRRLREQRVADGALHWEDLPGTAHLPERMSPAQYATVSESILRATRQEGVAERLRASLLEVGAGAAERARRQGAFFDSLGPCGLDEVAAALRRLSIPGTGVHEGASSPNSSDGRSQPWTS